MTKVGAQGIKLTDKLNGTRGNKRNIHIVNNGQREDFTWFDVNQLSDKYAWILHKHGRMAKTAAIIGMYSKQSMAWFIACCKLGNANCLLEPDYPDRFGILNDIEVDFVFIDKKYMKGDIRLEEYPSIKYIFWLNGGDAAHAEAGEIFPCESSSPEIISLDAEKWNNAEINESKKTVRTYSEEHTTIDTILTFASTSGSTGPPKILEYPNRFMGEFPIYTKDLQKKSDIFKLCCTFGCGRCIKMAKGKNNLGGVLNFVGHIMFNVVNYLSTARELNFTLLDRYDLEGNLLHIKEAPVNTLVLYLPMLLDLIRTKSFPTSGINVQAIQVTGALMTPEIYTKVRDAFKQAHFDPPEIFSAYGSTELGSIVFRPGLFDSTWVKQNTVGRINPAPGYDFRIRDIETEEIKWTASEGIKNGVENGGEIEILSPIRMRGYRDLVNLSSTYNTFL
jgi:acyl-coenzyme A synthetase/AMP-(fatty) acid ligase